MPAPTISVPTESMGSRAPKKWVSRRRNGSARRCISWIAAQVLEQRAALAEPREGAPEVRIVAVAFELGEKDVIPRLLAARARLEARKVYPLLVEDRKNTHERPAPVTVTNAEGHRRLVAARSRCVVEGKHHEAR